jgi:hypothetical protein
LVEWCARGSHDECHAPARQRTRWARTYGPWRGPVGLYATLFGVRAANLGIRALALPRPARMLCVPHRQRHQKVPCVPASRSDWRDRPGVAKALGQVPSACALSANDKRSNMKLDDATFRQLRRLAPVLDDVLNAGEVEHADQAVNLASLAQLCSQLFDAYHDQHPGEIAQAQLDALESQ